MSLAGRVKSLEQAHGLARGGNCACPTNRLETRYYKGGDEELAADPRPFEAICATCGGERKRMNIVIVPPKLTRAQWETKYEPTN